MLSKSPVKRRLTFQTVISSSIDDPLCESHVTHFLSLLYTIPRKWRKLGEKKPQRQRRTESAVEEDGVIHSHQRRARRPTRMRTRIRQTPNGEMPVPSVRQQRQSVCDSLMLLGPSAKGVIVWAKIAQARCTARGRRELFGHR